METINIYGANRFAEHTKVRDACRGIVIRDGMILLTYEVNTDQWFIPGGGLEGEETTQQCCIRELAEETGYVVKPQRHFVTINEYYEEWLYVSHYFTCEITGETQRLLTEREAEVGLEPRWIPLQEAVTIFSKHQDYAYDEMKRGGYLREYKALLAFMDAGQGLYELAMKHIYGDGVPEDNELAVKLLTQAHAIGHAEATYNLGICYHYGYGTVVDLAKAYNLYLESANSGYGKGMELIGRFYNRGIYVEQDRKQAEYWLQKAMESTDPDAVAEARKELAKMDNVFIRKAIPGDEQVLAYIQTESWKAAFAGILSPEELERCTDIQKAEQMYHSILRRKGCNMAIELVDHHPHCIAAWGTNRCDLGNTVGELICIHSLQNNWAKGYGSAMMEYVLAQLQQAQYESVILWVFEANTRARKFYEKHGFELTEQKKLANGIAELMYMKNI